MSKWTATIFIVLFIQLAALSAVPHGTSYRNTGQVNSTINQASTSGGFLYVNPDNITNLPVNSDFTIGIQVSNMSFFNGWDIYVQTNPSIITPVSASFSNDLFETNSTPPVTPQLLGECIDGVPYTAAQCNQPEGPGIIELAAAALTKPNLVTPIYGLVFNITYRVVASTGGSLIQVPSATLSNGSSTGITPATVNGVYGILSPDFTVSTNPSSLSVVAGYNGTATISLTSINHFQGTIEIAASGTLGVLIANPTLTLTSGGTATTSLTIITANAGTNSYTETITASNGTSPNSISHVATLSINLEQSQYFVLSLSLSLLQIHAGNSANTTIIVQSYGFNGNVTLNVQAPLDLGVTYFLASQSLILYSGPSPLVPAIFSTGLDVSTPVTSLPYLYLLNITATGLSPGRAPLIRTFQLKVTPPPASFTVSINPSTVVVPAGGTTTATVTVDSVDYFWGFLYASAVMSGGAVGFNSSIYYIALPNSPHVSYIPQQDIGMTLKIDTGTPPGNYIALLTVYSLSSSYERAYSTQVPIEVSVDSPVLHAANEVFGLPAWTYFAILAALAVPLVLLSIQTYRRREREDMDWRT